MDQDPYIPPQADVPAPVERTAAPPKGCGSCLPWFGGLMLLGLIFVALTWWEVNSKFRRSVMTDAQATCMAVFNSIEQFQTEYHHLPAPTSAVKGKDWDTDSSAAENIISILKALDGTANPKNIDFLGDIKDAKTTDGKRLNGLVRTETTAALVDPWGHPYLIRLDGGGDGFVADPDRIIPGNRIPRKAIVWSAGKDGDPETWKDNIGSWSSAR